ncbi:hypothetical protein D9M71_188310 [compost metagenome]
MLDIRELRTGFQGVGPGVSHFLEQRRKVRQLLCVMGLAFEIDHRAARRRRQRVGERFGFQAELVDVVIERGGRHRKAHATQFGHDAFGAVEGLGAQTATHFRGFVDDRFQPQLHQLIRGHQTGNPAADNRHFGTVIVLGNAAQPGRVFDPVVEGERKVRAENGDWFFTVCRMAIVLVHG